DPERAHLRGGRRRRALEGRARHGHAADRRRRAHDPLGAGLGCRGERGRAARASLAEVTLRERLGGLAQRGGIQAAGRFGLEVYRPLDDYRWELKRTTTYVEDGRPIRDRRATTNFDGRDLTLTVEGLEDVLADSERGLRVLEVGPKYGFHSRWLDHALVPS